jgi:outer membrane protein assembly factor BamB
MRGFLVISFLVTSLLSAGDWPQAFGPNGDFTVNGKAVDSFSVSMNENILWRTPMPSTGQGTPIISNGRIFVTSHERIEEDSEMGSDIVGICLDIKTGKKLWERKIPGTRTTDLSSLFSDNTAASPVSDGERVVFMNVGGTIACFDFEGRALWAHKWTPFGRHHARAHEPILHNVMVVVAHTPKYDLPVEATTKEGSKALGRGKEYWNFLRAYNLQTGKLVWQAEAGTSVHSTSMLGQFAKGKLAILTGRGGGHQPPEEPYGLSMIDVTSGKSIWDISLKGYAAAQNASWNKNGVHFFAGGMHKSLSSVSGKMNKETSIFEKVTITKWNGNQYETKYNQTLKKSKKPITYFTNILIGNYHYFRSFDGFMIGRVNLKNGKVEYLEVPGQVIRQNEKDEELLWGKTLPNDMRNAGGFKATKDKRNAGSGWGHVSSAPPIVVGDRIYFPTMVGMVYVLKWNADSLDESALISISDLGRAGETWSLSGLAYVDGKIFARTMKELICIGE